MGDKGQPRAIDRIAEDVVNDAYGRSIQPKPSTGGIPRIRGFFLVRSWPMNEPIGIAGRIQKTVGHAQRFTKTTHSF